MSDQAKLSLFKIAGYVDALRKVYYGYDDTFTLEFNLNTTLKTYRSGAIDMDSNLRDYPESI